MNEQEKKPEVAEDPISHLDFDIDATCEVRWVFGKVSVAPEDRKPCGKPAQWLVSCRNCGQSGYCCNAHKLRMQLDTINRRSRCGAVGPLSMVLRFSPIGRA